MSKKSNFDSSQRTLILVVFNRISKHYVIMYTTERKKDGLNHHIRLF